MFYNTFNFHTFTSEVSIKLLCLWRSIRPLKSNFYASSALTIVIATLLTTTLTTLPATAATVYTYRDANGQVLITNKKPARSKEYTLLNSVSFVPYRDRKSNGQSNPYFSKAIKSQYDSLIINLSEKHDIDPAFVKAVIHIESAFRHDAVSHAGAMGLMQLMPATARSYDLDTDQFEPQKNMNVGITHLKYLMDRYENDKTLSLAAYNAGETAVAKYDGIPPFEETQNYVVKVLKLYDKYKDSFTG